VNFRFPLLHQEYKFGNKWQFNGIMTVRRPAAAEALCGTNGRTPRSFACVGFVIEHRHGAAVEHALDEGFGV
jgi:hypothetical protein